MSTTAIIKCRELLGRLKTHGIQASRPTLGAADDGPSALLVADDGRAWLAAIWGGASVQPQLLADDASGTQPSLDQVLWQLIQWRNAHRPDDHAPVPELLILAPALDPNELPLQQWQVAGEALPVLARTACGKAEPLAKAILSLVGPVLPKETIDLWRALAVPEVRIDRPLRRKAVVRAAIAPVAPLLLDYNQERCARLDLETPADLQTLADDLSVRVVTGVAGCGKTLVLVHRAALLTAHFPSARVLIVSHNKPLIADLQRRVKRFKAGDRVHCRTFYSWLTNAAPGHRDILKPHEVKRWMSRDRQAHDCATLNRYSNEWLVEEMGWMFDHQHVGDSYLEVERKGRGIPLTKPQRRDMLAIARRYRDHLRATDSSDWSELPLHLAEQNLPAFQQPAFDHILIDEAQFFAPVWLRLLLGVLKPGGHVFLCADPTQGFLRRRTSWAEVGLAVRNRSHRLEKPYRSTRAILQFARDFYQRRLPNDEEPLNLPAPEWMQTLEPGEAPIVQPGGARQEQVTRLIRELEALQKGGVHLSEVLILAAGRDHLEKMIVDQIRARLGPDSAFLVKDSDAPDHAAGVAHLMAATGLERPIVFLLGLDDLAAEENNPTLDTDEQAEKRLEHTRLIYVGLTRAMEKLVVYSSHAALKEALGAVEGSTRIA